MLPPHARVPDPELIESCRHHLLPLIPPQYLCLGGPHLGGGARAGWGAGPEGICCSGSCSICYYFSLSRTRGIRFLPKVAFPVHCQSHHCPPPVPTVPPAWLLAVCDPDTARLGCH